MRNLFLSALVLVASCGAARSPQVAGGSDYAVRLRVINNATCDIQLRVLQRGAWQKTIDVPSLSTLDAAVTLKGLEEPLTYRVAGAGCRFDPYDIPASSVNATDLDVVVADTPVQAVARVRVRSR